MDLVSIETPDEYEWLKQRIGSKFYIILKGANTTGAASTDTARVSLCAWEHSPLGHAVSPVQANKQYFYAAPAQVVHSVLSRYNYSCFDLTSKKVPKNYKIMRLFTSVICA